MKKRLLIFVLCVIPVISAYGEEEKIDPSVVEFARLMGLEKIINSTMDQTRESLNSMIGDLFQDFKNKYPNMTDEQNKKLDQILSLYVDTVINSVDTEKAVYIYAKIISEEMTPDERKVVSDFYKSDEGKNMQEVVGAAANRLNAYMLDEITKSVKIAQKKLVEDIGAFKNELAADEKSTDQIQ